MAGIRGVGRSIALGASLAVFAGGFLVATAGADDNVAAVTWPAVAGVNPETTTYPVTTSYDGPQFLFLTTHDAQDSSNVFPPQHLPSVGMVDVQLPGGFNGSLVLTPVLCPSADYSSQTCTSVGSPHVIAVANRLWSQLGADAASWGPKSRFWVEMWPTGGTTIDMKWEVVPADLPDGAAVVEGTTADLPVEEYYAPLPALGDAAGLVHGERYIFRATFEGDVGDFGPLTGSDDIQFVWDDQVGVTGMRFRLYDEYLDKTIDDPNVFYPKFDYGWIDGTWRDDIEIVVAGQNTERLDELGVTVMNSAGQIVRSNLGLAWDGTNNNRNLVPEGVYTLSLHAVDELGNEATSSATFGSPTERSFPGPGGPGWLLAGR
jgi:hypothetical protein